MQERQGDVYVEGLQEYYPVLLEEFNGRGLLANNQSSQGTEITTIQADLLQQLTEAIQGLSTLESASRKMFSKEAYDANQAVIELQTQGIYKLKAQLKQEAIEEALKKGEPGPMTMIYTQILEWMAGLQKWREEMKINNAVKTLEGRADSQARRESEISIIDGKINKLEAEHQVIVDKQIEEIKKNQDKLGADGRKKSLTDLQKKQAEELKPLKNELEHAKKRLSVHQSKVQEAAQILGIKGDLSKIETSALNSSKAAALDKNNSKYAEKVLGSKAVQTDIDEYLKLKNQEFILTSPRKLTEAKKLRSENGDLTIESVRKDLKAMKLACETKAKELYTLNKKADKETVEELGIWGEAHYEALQNAQKSADKKVDSQIHRAENPIIKQVTQGVRSLASHVHQLATRSPSEPGSRPR